MSLPTRNDYQLLGSKGDRSRTAWRMPLPDLAVRHNDQWGGPEGRAAPRTALVSSRVVPMSNCIRHFR